MRRCDISHLTLKGLSGTRSCCAMAVKKHLPQRYDRPPGTRCLPQSQGDVLPPRRAPALLVGLEAKKKAAHGPKCDQCVYLMMLFVCFLSSGIYLYVCKCFEVTAGTAVVGWSLMSWAILVSGGRIQWSVVKGKSCIFNTRALHQVMGIKQV